MSDSIKNNTKVAIKVESVEGTYAAPDAGSDFIQPLSDGMELSPSKELLERSTLNSSIGKSTPRSGMRSVSATLPVEAKAHGTAGTAPEFGPLLQAALGSKRNADAITTKSSGNTGTVLQIENADIADLNVGDMILIKESGGYHVSPITAVDDTTDASNITLLVPKESGNFSDSVVIEAFTTYMTANSGHPTLSVSKYIEDARLESAYGCRVSSMSLNNFSTGQLSDFSFSLEGIGWNQSLTAPPVTPSFDTALPAIVLSASVYQNATKTAVNEVSISLENSIAFKTSTASENGKISSRISDRTVSGSINPYKQNDSLTQFNNFKNDTEFSIFGYMAVPTGTSGEFKDVVAFYMPKCFIENYSEGDQDGLLQEVLEFKATRGPQGETEELYLSFI